MGMLLLWYNIYQFFLKKLFEICAVDRNDFEEVVRLLTDIKH